MVNWSQLEIYLVKTTVISLRSLVKYMLQFISQLHHNKLEKINSPMYNNKWEGRRSFLLIIIFLKHLQFKKEIKTSMVSDGLTMIKLWIKLHNIKQLTLQAWLPLNKILKIVLEKYWKMIQIKLNSKSSRCQNDLNN